jgi:aspartyl-tRNA(Asn)/glutamyl-tRNA(Gln) amidotransferase subunit A
MARSVGDAAIMLQAIAGYDAKEPTSYDEPVQDYAAEATRTDRLRIRLGVPREFFYSELQPEVNQAAEQALAVLADLGAEVREVAMGVSTDRTIILAEAYTYQAENMAKHADLYLPETLAKFQLGAGIDMSAYIQARLRLDQHRRQSAKFFETVDVLATPTTPVPAPEDREIPTKFEEIMAKDSLLWRNTRPFNLSALPTVSVPCGFTKSRVANRVAAQRGTVARNNSASARTRLRRSNELACPPPEDLCTREFLGI